MIFTQHDTLQLVREAKEAGAEGYLLKSDAQNLVAAVETIGQHKTFFKRERTGLKNYDRRFTPPSGPAAVVTSGA